MAPVIAAVGTLVAGTSASGATHSFAKPSGVVDGSMLVAVYTVEHNGSGTLLAAPSDWAAPPDAPAFQAVASGTALYVWFKIVTDAGSEPSTYAMPVQTGRWVRGAILRIADHDETDPWEAGDGAVAANSTSTPAVAVTAGGADRLAIWAASSYSLSGWPTMPTGFTEHPAWASDTTNTTTLAYASPASGATVGEAVATSATAGKAAWIGLIRPSAGEAVSGSLAAAAPMLTAAVTGTVEERDPPGAHFDLSNWKVTTPYDGPDENTTADEIEQPELDTYQDENFHLDDEGNLVMRAPVVGATTSGSGSTRYEFREMGDTDWNLATTAPRRLTVTGRFDPSSIVGGTQPRQEMIIGQIHGPSGTPPLYLSIEYTSGTAGNPVTPRLRVFKDGPGLANVLTGLTTSTEITYRIDVRDARVKLYCAIGTVENLPLTPQFDWAAADFTEDTSVCYFKAGPYNKSLAANGNSGAAVATISHLELLQGDVPDPGIAGSVNASIPGPPTAALAAATFTSGTLAASLPLPTGTSTGDVLASTLTATLPKPGAAIVGDVNAGPGSLVRLPRIGVDKIGLRVTGGGDAPVRIDFSLSSDMSNSTSSVAVAPGPQGDAHVPIPASLTPDTTYYFRCWRNGSSFGTVRSFRTLPGTASSTMTFGFASCRNTDEDAAVLSSLGARGVDLFLFTGDMHYRDLNTTDASSYRTADDEPYTRTHLGATLTGIPNDQVWDNHDFCGDFSNRTSTGRATVAQVFRERVPTPDLPSSGGIYHTFTAWGGRVRFIVLDCRYYRDHYQAAAPRTMLGTEQLAWLDQVLLDANEPLTFIVSSVGWHSAGTDDDWGLYQEERAMVAGWIADATTEVVFLCGDMHRLAYATPAQGTPGGVHVWHAAALRQFDNGTKGGPYATATSYTEAGQYGLVTLADTGTAIEATFTGVRQGTSDWSQSDTVSAPTAATGGLAGSLPLPSASTTATVRATGALATSLTPPTASVTATTAAGGALAASLPAAASSIGSTLTTPGELAVTLPRPTAETAAVVAAGGALSGGLALPVASLQGVAIPHTGALVAELPPLSAALAAQVAVAADLTGSLPGPLADLFERGPVIDIPGLQARRPVPERGISAGAPTPG